MSSKSSDPQLSAAIRDGTFPDSDDVLSADLSSEAVQQLLGQIARDKQALNTEISQASKSLGSEVADWISRAKEVEADIARCKQEARNIVEEHSRVESRREEARELKRKSTLLQAEIDFTSGLQGQLESVSDVAQSLKEIEELIFNGRASQAAPALNTVHKRISAIRGPQVQRIIRGYEADLTARTKAKLEDLLYRSILVTREPKQYCLEILNSLENQSLDSILTGLIDVGASKEILQSLGTRLEAVLLNPLKQKSRSQLARHTVEASRLTVLLGGQPPTVAYVSTYIIESWDFLDSHLPDELVLSLVNLVLPKILVVFMSDWLTPAIPTSFDQLGQLAELQELVSRLASHLENKGWPGAEQLFNWIEQAPRIWLTKRKSQTLDAIRKAFKLSRGALQQVERTERKETRSAAQQSVTEVENDDWNTSWDEDKPEHGTANDDEANGWGFDDEDDHTHETNSAVPPVNEKQEANGDEDDDAWGWGEDDAVRTAPSSVNTRPRQNTNGARPDFGASQEIVLTELYSITDIPDHMVEIIGRDIQDAYTLAEDQHKSLHGIAPSKGLLALPTVALAMFRATAPTHYDESQSLSNMNLYNDALYITEKLRNINAPEDMPSLEQDCKVMEKFARLAYAKEMDTQRTILSDLLDGAQGFGGCTQPLYAREIETAVNSTVDRIRQVNEDWKPTLSTSALLQSSGALVTLVINKVINDIEDMEEISAPQSEKLVAFCTQITALEDLFIAKAPGGSDGGSEESVPMTAVYVSNWLKFQYLINILDSSLVDIKYLWTEGELGLEFTQEEVVDLIEALFQESSHRRSAIAAIKGNRGSGLR